MRIVSLFLISIITLYANVGNLSGNLSVNNGALNYNVALKLPAGIAGHTPQVSLNYNSNGANGYFGQGWSLTGLSTISRCGSNLEFDGVKKGVKYTSEDNICLDGQRLVTVSGNKWDDNSIYKTKIESYSKITLNSNIFTVYTKAGDIKEYTLINQTWYLTSIKDRYDNTITYNYTSNSSEVYLNNISYGDNIIQLNYEDKLDKYNGYSGGYNIQITKKVDSIDIKNGDSVLRNYDLIYKVQSSDIDKSLVESITECSSGACLKSIIFDYGFTDYNNFTFKGKANLGDQGVSYQEDNVHFWKQGDFNGDGMLDFGWIYTNPSGNSRSTIDVFLSNGDGTFTFKGKANLGDQGVSYQEDNVHFWKQGDFNGDGMLDFGWIYTNPSGNSRSTIDVFLSNGDGTFTFKGKANLGDQGVSYQEDNVHFWKQGDFNGDGMLDFGWIYTNPSGNSRSTIDVFLSNGDGTFTFKGKANLGDQGVSYQEDNVHFWKQGDFNGDGMLDFGWIYTNPSGNSRSTIDVFLSNGDGTFTFKGKANLGDQGVSYQEDNVHFWKQGDFNGDGMLDFGWIYTNPSGNSRSTIDVFLSNGDGTFTFKGKANLGDQGVSYQEDNVHFWKQGDFNGDGMLDFGWIYTNPSGNSRSTIDVFLSNGDGTFTFKGKANLGDQGVSYQEDNVHFWKQGDFNGDGMLDFGWIYTNPSGNSRSTIDVFLSNSRKPTLILITDSFKNETNINYKHLTEDEIYTKYTDSAYPNRDIQGSMQVVSSIVSKTPTGENSTTSYTYEGLKTNLKGLGSLGFAKITSINDLNDIKTVTEYNQNYPLVGTVNKTTTTMGSEVLSEATNTYSSTEVGGISKIYLNQSIVKNYQDAIHLSTTTNENSSFDTYGNILTTSSTIKDETTNEIFVTNKVDTYTNDETNWLLGKLTNSIVTSNAYGDTKTKETSFTYDETTGSLLSKTIEPNKTKWLKKSYTYNANGTLNTETISGADILSATTTYGYTYNGNTLISSSITNALGHSVNKTYDNEGKVLSITDANGIFTNFTYDNFGKKLSETKAGVTTTYTYAYDSSVEDSLYKVTVQRNGTAPKTTYYNSLGMALQTTTIGFDGRVIISSQKYDKYGNVVEKIKPHFEGDTSQSIYYTYDDYKRLSSTDSPGENTRIEESITYNGFSTTTTNAKQQNKTTTKNVLGKVVKIEEPMGASITYKYDALGNLIETKDANGITITLGYDIYGNKISQNDPDMGTWTYTYNALGKLVSQTDAKGQVTNITYDRLGRKISETIVGDSISSWEYDTTKKGKLYKAKKEDLSGNVLVEKEYSYTAQSQVNSIYTNISGKTFVKTYNYDSLGRVVTKMLPNGFLLINDYDDRGYLVSIKSSKTEIADFDRNHFFNLIQSTLNNSEDLYRTYLQHAQEAIDLFAKVDEYRAVAEANPSYASELNEIANQLEANAKAYDLEAKYYKKLSNNHKTAVDGYLSEVVNSNSINGIFEFEEFYSQLHSIYSTYSTNILSIASQYALNAADPINTSNEINYYLSISLEALAEATVASQKADNFENLVNNYSSTENELIAYQDVLSDKNYNYFYKVLKYNAYNQVVSYMSGNGLVTNSSFNNSGAIDSISTGYNYDNSIRDLKFTYDKLGNLTERTDSKLNVDHTYFYDNLNRVVNAQITTATTGESLSYNYDLSGNITFKSDVGVYSYNPNTHQVISAGAKTLTYDANGNVITNDTASFIYTPFNKPSQITTTDNTVSFYYDMNKKRYKNTKSNTSSTTYYIDKVYENTISFSGEQHKYLIYANGKVVSIYNTTDTSSSTKYLHYDSLNSVDTITNNLGVVESRMAYKPFGKKLNLDKNGNEVTTAPFTNRGYTGHEHIEGSSFIHMNARVYDSEIARFMSADTIIPKLFVSQDFNRYSYVRNNPLKYTDPSGHLSISAGGLNISIGSGGASVSYKDSEMSVGKDGVKLKLEDNEISVSEDGATLQIQGESINLNKNELKIAVIVAASAYTGGLASTFVGGGFAGALASGAVSGMVSGYGMDLAFNLEGSRWAMMREGAINNMLNTATSYYSVNLNPEIVSSLKKGDIIEAARIKAFENYQQAIAESFIVNYTHFKNNNEYGQYAQIVEDIRALKGDMSRENVIDFAHDLGLFQDYGDDIDYVDQQVQYYEDLKANLDSLNYNDSIYNYFHN